MSVEGTDAQYGKVDESDVIYKGENEAKVGGDMNNHIEKLKDIETDLTKDGAKENSGK